MLGVDHTFGTMKADLNGVSDSSLWLQMGQRINCCDTSYAERANYFGAVGPDSPWDSTGHSSCPLKTGPEGLLFDT